MRWLREPLVQLFLGGLLLFAAHRVLRPADPRRILISEELRQGLRADHRRRTGALPSPAEERALLARWVQTEALYREALALGLDRGDLIVRRRLVQKMELLAREEAALLSPDEATLAAWTKGHAAAYAQPGRLTIEQVFVPGAKGEPARMESIARALADGVDPATLGAPFVHGRVLASRTEEELDAVFGGGFGRATLAIEGTGWSQPIRSSYGWHLVRVLARSPEVPLDPARVPERARRDWLAAERDRLEREAVAQVVARYQITGAARP